MHLVSLPLKICKLYDIINLQLERVKLIQSLLLFDVIPSSTSQSGQTANAWIKIAVSVAGK